MHGSNTKTIAVPEEQDTLAFADSSLRWLNPLAPTSAAPEGLEETERSSLDIGTVMLAHDLLDSFTGLVGVVEGDGANVVVKDVGLDDAVEELATDETEFTIDCCGCSTNVVPASSGVVRKSGISVLEEGDGNYTLLAGILIFKSCYTYRASG